MIIACGLTLGWFATEILSSLSGPLMMMAGGVTFLACLKWIARRVEARKAIQSPMKQRSYAWPNTRPHCPTRRPLRLRPASAW